MKKVSFKKWFSDNGTELLKGWLRAREDGNEEEFGDWVIGEYDCYRETPHEGIVDDVYEIPYVDGILDHASKAEAVIWNKPEYEMTLSSTPGLFNVHEKLPKSWTLNVHTGPLVDCEKWIKEQQK